MAVPQGATCPFCPVLGFHEAYSEENFDTKQKYDLGMLLQFN